MAWKRVDPKDGKLCYLRKDGRNVTLTREKKGILADTIPEGFSVEIKDGRLKLRGK